jgi:hypothetical protein
MRKIRFSMRSNVNMGNYESIHIEYEEEDQVDLIDYEKKRKFLIKRVEKVVKGKIAEIRKTIDE